MDYTVHGVTMSQTQLSDFHFHFTSGVGGFSFLHTLPAFIICRHFDEGHSDQYDVIAHFSFDLHLITNDAKHLFMCFMAICMSSWEKWHFLVRLFVFAISVA